MDDASNSAAGAHETSGNVRCPCCGKYTLAKPIKVGNALLDQWMACMVTGEPFSREYALYGGKVLVTAVTRDTARASRLETALSAIDAAGDECMPASGRSALANALRLFSVVRTIEFSASPRRVFQPGAAADKAVDLILDGDGPLAERLRTASDLLGDSANVSSLPPNMLVAVGQAHATVTDILVDAGIDEDFWRGIELA